MRKDKKERKIQECPVCGKLNDREFKGGYCRKHHHQLKVYGRVKDNIPTTKFESNVFKTKGEVSYLITRDVLGQDTAIFKFDTEDLELVKRYKWRCNADGYCTSGYSSINLHRLVMEVSKGGQVDHINLDITDNRKCNLRLATNSLNQANKNPYNLLGFKGVECSNSKKYGKRYHATINREDTRFHSPVFNTIEEAIYARTLMEVWLWEGIPLTKPKKYSITDFQKSHVEFKMETMHDKIDNWLIKHNIKV